MREHTAPQCMPPMSLVTVPDPCLTTVNRGSKNRAVTVRSAFIVTVHVVLVPEQPPPDHPANTPVPGVAVRVTVVP